MTLRFRNNELQQSRLWLLYVSKYISTIYPLATILVTKSYLVNFI